MTQVLSHAADARSDDERVTDFCVGHGFEMPHPDDFEAIEEMAGRLMSHKVTPAHVFRQVQAVQPCSSFCFREEGAITGLIGVLLLRAPAVGQLLSGAFDGQEVDTDLLCRPGEAPAIGYGWGIAATTKASSAALNACVWRLRTEVLGHLAFLTTAVTPAGRHVCITRMGYRPLRGPDDGLLISDPIHARQAA